MQIGAHASQVSIAGFDCCSIGEADEKKFSKSAHLNRRYI